MPVFSYVSAWLSPPPEIRILRSFRICVEIRKGCDIWKWLFHTAKGSEADSKDFAMRKRADFLPPPAVSVFTAFIMNAANERAMISTCMTLLAKHLFTEAACIPMFQERK